MPILILDPQYCGVYVGYRTNKFTLPVTPLTVSLRNIFAIIFGNVIFLIFARVTLLPYWQICITTVISPYHFFIIRSKRIPQQ